MIITGNDQPDIAKRAWLARENGDPILAIALWSQLMREPEIVGEWEKAINYLVDISIAWKNYGKEVKGFEYALTALKTLGYAQFLAKRENIPLRKDWDLLIGKTEIDAKKFPEAINHLSQYLQSTQLNKEEEADIKCHLGFVLANSSDKKAGLKLLKEGLGVLVNSTEDIVYQNKNLISIWRTGAKLKLAQVVDNRKLAKQLIEAALQEAKDKSLGARIKEAEGLLAKLF